MMDLGAEKETLMVRFRELQAQVANLEAALRQTQHELAKTMGVIEWITQKMQRQAVTENAALVPDGFEVKR